MELTREQEIKYGFRWVECKDCKKLEICKTKKEIDMIGKQGSSATVTACNSGEPRG